MFGTKAESGLKLFSKKMVGERRFELPTSWSRTKRATKLRYSPLEIKTVIRACTP
jgi:hypothetical protein